MPLRRRFGRRRWRGCAARRLVEMRAALDASLIAHGQTADESEREEEDAAANSARSELNNKKSDD